MNDFESLEIEPDAPVDPPNERLLMLAKSSQILQALPPDFPLKTLLMFLPDVAMKDHANSLAAQALKLDVSGTMNLRFADGKLAELRKAVADIEACFVEPVSLANQLHKRLTKLRSDFTSAADAAVTSLSSRIILEQRRLEQEANAAQRRAQEEADRQAREAAARAAREAKERGAPKATVTALREQAKTATAPPVATMPLPSLGNSSKAQKWKGRIRGTEPGEEPNPSVPEMNAAQQEQVMQLLDGIRNSRAPLAFIDINWSVVNKHAVGAKTTFDYPGLEAFDEGSLRAKATR
jgi:hypothetical protein